MIARIEALNYKCLRHVSRGLQRFQILVGPNASGKSTFLDVPALLAETVGLKNCVEPSFVKFQDTLQKWFPEEG